MQINGNKGILVVIAVVLIGVFAIMLVSITQKSEGEKIGESISDKNTDDKVSNAEFETGTFNAYDDNGDGTLSREEWKSVLR